MVLGLALIEIIDIVELPFESQLADTAKSSLVSISSLTSTMKSLGYLGLFILMTLESASAPIPSEVVLPFAGYLVFLDSMDLIAAVAVSTVAGVLGGTGGHWGGLVDYCPALLVGRPFLDRLPSRMGVRPGSSMGLRNG